MRIVNRLVILIGLFTVVVLLLKAQLLAAAIRQTFLVVQEGPGKVVLFSADNPSQRKSIKVGDKPHEIELTPDGRTAFVSNFGLLEVNLHVGTPGTTISVLDVERGVERTRFRLPAGEMDNACACADGSPS